MDKLYIVMPAYNEEQNIKDTVKTWYPILAGKSEDSRLVVADSGSTDSTHTILEEMRNEYPKMEILSDTGTQHGPKVIALYNYSLSQKADFIFQTDSDGQTNPDEFEVFWNMRNEYDVILGQRCVRGDGKARAFVERVVCLLLKLYFGVKVPDANAPFRLMKSDVVEQYVHRLPVDYNLPNIMMTTYFVYNREKVAFKPITFKPRQGGTNSINISKIVKIGWKSLRDFRYFKQGCLESEKNRKHNK